MNVIGEIGRTIAVIVLGLAFLAVAGLASVYGSDDSASIMWGASLVMLAGLTAIHNIDQRRRSLLRLAQYLAISVLFFGGLWFISAIKPGETLSGFMWPLAAVVGILIVTLNIDQIGAAFRQTRIIVRKVSFGGVEVELDRGAVDRVERELSSAIRNLFDSVDREYRRQVRIRKVDQRLAQLHRLLPEFIFPGDTAKQNGLRQDSSFRSTVHISDVVFQEFMYQLTDYASTPGGSGAGRRFSKRRGIVGLSWRLKESLGQGDVFSGQDRDRQLVERWGMFDSETGPAFERPSCLTVILKSEDGREVGLLYVDSKNKDAFGDDPASGSAATALAGQPKVIELGTAVAAVDLVMKELALNLDLSKLSV